MCGMVPPTYKKHTKLCIQYHKHIAYLPKLPGINLPKKIQNILRVRRGEERRKRRKREKLNYREVPRWSMLLSISNTR